MKKLIRRELHTFLMDNEVPIVIVGAGAIGKKLVRIINKWNLGNVSSFFDNQNVKWGSKVEGYEIKQPCCEGDKIYLISVQNELMREEIYYQLIHLGIPEKLVVAYDDKDSLQYRKRLEKALYPYEVEEVYYDIFGAYINHEDPHNYNEIINLEKLYLRDERRAELSDKYLVKSWVEKQIGAEYVVKLYGVWDKAKEIDFNNLPNSFVLKVNNGSERNIVVKDKRSIDLEKVREQLDEWMNTSFEYVAFEPHYGQIIPKILCEEYIEGIADDLYDYNVYCFHGQPKYIWCIKESHKENCVASFYDTAWNKQEFSYGYPPDGEMAPRPKQLEKMLELSRVLSADFKHVRVDWYITRDGRIFFGEMTFSTWAGYMRFIPQKWDRIFGNLIKGVSVE